MVSRESQDLDYFNVILLSSDDDEDSDKDNDFDYMIEEMYRPFYAEIENLNSQLYADIENMINMYGENILTYRLLKEIDEIDIELNIPLGS